MKILWKIFVINIPRAELLTPSLPCPVSVDILKKWKCSCPSGTGTTDAIHLPRTPWLTITSEEKVASRKTRMKKNPKQPNPKAVQSTRQQVLDAHRPCLNLSHTAVSHPLWDKQPSHERNTTQNPQERSSREGDIKM